MEINSQIIFSLFSGFWKTKSLSKCVLYEVNVPIIWNWAHWASLFPINSFCVIYVFLTKKVQYLAPHFPFIWFFKCVLVIMVLFSAGNVGVVFWIFMLLEDPNWGWDCNFIQFAFKGYGRSAELGCSLCIQVLWELWYQTWHSSSVTFSQRRAWRGNLLAGWTTMLVYLCCLSWFSHLLQLL